MCSMVAVAKAEDGPKEDVVANPERKPILTVGVWLSIAALAISIVGGGMIVLSQFFAPKSIETSLAVIQEKQTTLDNRLASIDSEQGNLTAQVVTLNLNVVRLMERFDLDVVPVPPPRPRVPIAPAAPPSTP